ncbi:hypothetical protein DEA8626_00855 [Defluviimonas aquaemixtae]|uniref:Lipoprotein n=1 Tax=Albidovulum aquaemixtae TaxID=1542388 RepID=A0A2R8B416_9RHOB|nr:hypothetical protein [Defluviimonas aquaemixtae]SPH17337.1 hypothetical protein DEA8626_00855 [Defluviimonas aquaemixtae]
MTRPVPLLALLAGLSAGLSACAETPAPEAPAEPVYIGSNAAAMGGDLHGFIVTMEGGREAEDMDAYVECVVAGYALEKKQGFARKVRTYVRQEGGVWIADAVYTISPTLPRGLKTIDAEVAVADCAERGIPTV